MSALRGVGGGGVYINRTRYTHGRVPQNRRVSRARTVEYIVFRGLRYAFGVHVDGPSAVTQSYVFDIRARIRNRVVVVVVRN